MTELKCKNCGGSMTVDETNEYMVCEYCGAKEKIIKTEAELRQESIEKREENRQILKQKSKAIWKKIKKIILILIIIDVAFFVIMTILGFCGVFDDESTTTDVQTSEKAITQSVNENPTSTYNNNVQNSESIEIADLFSGGLESAEEVLEPQSKDPQDIEAYTRYTFDCVSVMCEYGTNSIYSISVNYTNKNTNANYTVFGLNENTTRKNWDEALGESYYQGYDSDGNPVYSYELEYDENTTYSIEITATSDCPDKITVYKQYT